MDVSEADWVASSWILVVAVVGVLQVGCHTPAAEERMEDGQHLNDSLIDLFVSMLVALHKFVSLQVVWNHNCMSTCSQILL